MDIVGAINELKAKGEAFNPVTDADYMQNGILMCGNCHTPKRKAVTMLGKDWMMPIACRCANERFEADEARERKKEADRLRRECFVSPELFGWNFANDDGKDAKLSKAAREYVGNFDKFLEKGKGLIFFGPTGRGKSFIAGCIANALMDKGKPCLMTNFSNIERMYRNRFGVKEENSLDLSRYKLLCLDDFGAERDTAYMQEIVFSVIDERYQARLPLLLTTNLTIEELKKPKNITEERIFKRVLERCFPIEATGPDRRVLNIREDYDGMKEMLGL